MTYKVKKNMRCSALGEVLCVKGRANQDSRKQSRDQRYPNKSREARFSGYRQSYVVESRGNLSPDDHIWKGREAFRGWKHCGKISVLIVHCIFQTQSELRKTVT